MRTGFIHDRAGECPERCVCGCEDFALRDGGRDECERLELWTCRECDMEFRDERQAREARRKTAAEEPTDD